MNCPHCQAPLRPGKAFCVACGRPIAMSAPPPPPPLPAFHRPAPQPQSSGSGIGERIWDVLSVGGASAVSSIWYWYTGLAGRAGENVKPDYLSCFLIVLLPVLGILFRKPLDGLLMHLQPAMSKLPSRVRLGVGLAIPFLVSNHLYASGVSNYPLMSSSTLFGTVLTFLVLRIPKKA